MSAGARLVKSNLKSSTSQDPGTDRAARLSPVLQREQSNNQSCSHCLNVRADPSSIGQVQTNASMCTHAHLRAVSDWTHT